MNLLLIKEEKTLRIVEHNPIKHRIVIAKYANDIAISYVSISDLVKMNLKCMTIDI